MSDYALGPSTLELAALAAGHVAPPTLVVSGGRRGVGATTLAVQLATALAQDALRVVLIDANLTQPDVSTRCKIGGGIGIGDVLAGSKNIHEALQLGPAGIQVLAGSLADSLAGSPKTRAIHRLLKQTRSLAPHADWLVVDAGNQPTEMAAQWWSAASQLLVVTSPEAAAVMDTYALIKTLISQQGLTQLPGLIVNQAAEEATARDVHRRIDQSCKRFLGLAIEFAGWLPLDPGTKAIVIGSAVLAPAVMELAHRLYQRQHKVPVPAAA